MTVQDIGGSAPCGVPLWRADGRSHPVCPLPAGEDAQVAIVGGGVAGLSTALHLRQHGVDVVVVDAVAAHRDGACASAGIVAPQLIRNSPHTVLTRLGQERGAAFLAMVAESGDYLFRTIAGQGIVCDAAQAGFMAPIAGRKKAAQLHRLIDEWRPWRSDLSLLTGEDVRKASGCTGYDAALVDASGGGLDPAALVDGLDDAARRLGARVYRGAAVEQIVEQDDGWLVCSATGSVRARRVLLAANGGNARLAPRLRGTVLPLPVCEMATRPLPEDILATILPGGETLTDISTDVFSLRLDAHGRLITALGVSGATRSAADIEEAVQARLATMLPSYRRVPLEYIWQGTAWLNTSFLPRAVPLADGLTAIQACNGRGLANNFIIGREMARWLAEDGYTPMLPLESPRSVPGFMIARHIPRLAMVGSAAVRRIFRRSTAAGQLEGGRI